MDRTIFNSRPALVDHLGDLGRASDEEAYLRVENLSLALLRSLAPTQLLNLALVGEETWERIREADVIDAPGNEPLRALMRGLKKGRSLIHSVPSPVPKEALVELRTHGAVVDENNLVDGAYYFGTCRNGNVGRWNAHKGRWLVMRRKFGTTYADRYACLTNDDDRMAIFLPFCRVEPGRGEVIQETFPYRKASAFVFTRAISRWALQRVFTPKSPRRD